MTGGRPAGPPPINHALATRIATRLYGAVPRLRWIPSDEVDVFVAAFGGAPGLPDKVLKLDRPGRRVAAQEQRLLPYLRAAGVEVPPVEHGGAEPAGDVAGAAVDAVAVTVQPFLERRGIGDVYAEDPAAARDVAVRLRRAAARLHALPVAAYPSDVSDDEWAFAAPYLALVREDAAQWEYPLREVFNGLRYIVKIGGQWRWMPHDLPPWPVVYQQARRWLAAGVFEALLHDLRALLRLAQGRRPAPLATVFDSQTLQSTTESGAHAGYDGAKRKRGSKVHAAVDTLGHLLALIATTADAQDRAQVAASVAAVQAATGAAAELAQVDQGYTGPAPAAAAAADSRFVMAQVGLYAAEAATDPAAARERAARAAGSPR